MKTLVQFSIHTPEIQDPPLYLHSRSEILASSLAREITLYMSSAAVRCGCFLEDKEKTKHFLCYFDTRERDKDQARLSCMPTPCSCKTKLVKQGSTIVLGTKSYRHKKNLPSLNRALPPAKPVQYPIMLLLNPACIARQYVQPTSTVHFPGH